MTTLTAPSLALGLAPKVASAPRALVRLCSQSQRQLLGLRLGRLYGFGIGLSYGLLALAGPAEADVAGKLWARCLVTASWVAGVGALSLSSDLAARDDAQGISGLSRLRGFGEAALERARLIAGALRLTVTVLVPGLLVCAGLAARLRTLPGALTALFLCALTVPYAVLVGGVLASLARACHHLLPGRGRWLLAAAVLGPWLVAAGTGAPVPSIPAAFSWVLSQAVRSLH